MFKILSVGDVIKRNPEEKGIAGSRIALLPDGRLACTFNESSASGVNDFATLISYSDDGESWSGAKYAFPEYYGKKSLFTSIRNTLDGRVCIGGFVMPTYSESEPWWDNDSGSMLENKLLYSVSEDGYNFSKPQEIELPLYGAAEIPGGVFVDKDGSINILYSPYKTIENREKANINQLVIARSDNEGKTFYPITFGEVLPPCQYGESWVVRVSDKIHMAATWQTAVRENANKYFMSYDGMKTFEGPFDLPFNGQALALEPMDDGRVLVIYNLRNREPAGVYLAMGKPDRNGFNLIANECIWQAPRKTASGTGGEFDEWMDFAFGEPHIKILTDNTAIASLWYNEGTHKGIKYVKIAFE